MSKQSSFSPETWDYAPLSATIKEPKLYTVISKGRVSEYEYLTVCIAVWWMGWGKDTYTGLWFKKGELTELN